MARDIDSTGQSERVVDAIRASAADTESNIADMAADEAITRRALNCSAPRPSPRGGPAVSVPPSSFVSSAHHRNCCRINLRCMAGQTVTFW
jgi:hypothetical protein